MTRFSRIASAAACLAILASAGTAFAQSTCAAAPPIPTLANLPPNPTPPATPSCINLQTMISTCPEKQTKEWKANNEAYILAFNARVEAVTAYLNAGKAWHKTVTEFIRCEDKFYLDMLRAEKAASDAAQAAPAAQ